MCCSARLNARYPSDASCGLRSNRKHALCAPLLSTIWAHTIQRLSSTLSVSSIPSGCKKVIVITDRARPLGLVTITITGNDRKRARARERARAWERARARERARIIFQILVELGFLFLVNTSGSHFLLHKIIYAMCWHPQEGGRHQRRRRAPTSAPRLPRSVTAASSAVTAPTLGTSFEITQRSAGRSNGTNNMERARARERASAGPGMCPPGLGTRGAGSRHDRRLDRWSLKRCGPVANLGAASAL